LHDASFNDANSAMPISFDQILNSDILTVLYKEENVYGDRAIDSTWRYVQNQLFEAERVKRKIRDFESDMWIINFIFCK
jgi:hypothetical protein